MTYLCIAIIWLLGFVVGAHWGIGAQKRFGGDKK